MDGAILIRSRYDSSVLRIRSPGVYAGQQTKRAAQKIHVHPIGPIGPIRLIMRREAYRLYPPPIATKAVARSASLAQGSKFAAASGSRAVNVSFAAMRSPR